LACVVGVGGGGGGEGGVVKRKASVERG